MVDTETGWYLRHRDGIEHGPFRWVDLLSAAKLGNIAADTCVRHEIQTLDQWVFAPRIQPIAEVMTKGAPRSVKVRPTRATPRETSITGDSKIPQPSSATNLPVSSARTTTQAKPEEARSVDRMPIVRPIRDEGYPVPKSFINACAALVDLRFRWFVTPWIVKILWSLSLAGAIIWSAQLAYEHFIQTHLPDAINESDVATRGNWEFEPLGGQPILQTGVFRFLVGIGILVVTLLCVRVVCELSILVFENGSHAKARRRKG